MSELEYSPSNRKSDVSEANNYKHEVSEKALSILRKCSDARNIDEALKIITDQAASLVGGVGGSVWLRNSENHSEVVLRWSYRTDGKNQIGVSKYTNTIDQDKFYDGLTGWVFATGQSLCLSNIEDKDEIKKYPHLKWKDKFDSFKSASSTDKKKQRPFMAVPIRSCRIKQQVIGVLRIGASKAGEPFNKTQLELLETIAGYISGTLTIHLKGEEERALIIHAKGLNHRL